MSANSQGIDLPAAVLLTDRIYCICILSMCEVCVSMYGNSSGVIHIP